jgi:broad specificity phosphatase PhoE
MGPHLTLMMMPTSSPLLKLPITRSTSRKLPYPLMLGTGSRIIGAGGRRSDPPTSKGTTPHRLERMMSAFRSSSMRTSSSSSSSSSSSLTFSSMPTSVAVEDGAAAPSAAPEVSFSRRELIVVRHGETEWNRELRVQGVTDVPLNSKGILQASACARGIAERIAEEALLPMFPSSPSSPSSPRGGPPQLPSLRRPVPRVIHSSQMSRASATAEAIARSLSSSSFHARDGGTSDSDANSSSLRDGEGTGGASSVSKHPALNEWNLGVLEGLRREEASRLFPDDWRIFSEWANPYVSTEHSQQRVSGGGESMEDVRLRVVAHLESLVLRDGSDGGGIIVVDNDKNSKNGAAAAAMAHHNLAADVVVVSHGGVLGQLLRHVLVAQYPQDVQEEKRLRDAASSPSQVRNTTMTSHYPRPVNACITRFSIDPTTHEWTILSWADASHLVGEAAPIDTNYAGSGK